MTNGKSTFVNDRDAVESFISRGWHGFWSSTVVKQATPEVEAALLEVGKGAVNAALTAHNTADNHGQSVLEAAEAGATNAAKAQEGVLIQSGIALEPTALSALAGLVTAHVQAGPAPPSA